MGAAWALHACSALNPPSPPASRTRSEALPHPTPPLIAPRSSPDIDGVGRGGQRERQHALQLVAAQQQRLERWQV